MEKQRAAWLDYSRAIAMMFVLLGHAGISIPGISRFVLLFYVPLFFVAAGYVCREKEERFSAFVLRRARRLLIPYFGYSLFFYFFYIGKELAGGRAGGIALLPLGGIFYARNSLYPPGVEPNVLFMSIWNSPLWFLPALFLSEICFAGICRWSRADGRRLLSCMIICLLSGALLKPLLPVLLPWSLESVPLFVVLLWIGYETRQRGGVRQRQLPLFFIAAAGTGLWNGGVNVSVGSFGRSAAAGIAGMACASLFVMGACARADEMLQQRKAKSARICRRILSAAGQNTLPVMCWHLFVYMWIQGAAGLTAPGIAADSGAAGICFRIFMALGTFVITAAIAQGMRAAEKKIRQRAGR